MVWKKILKDQAYRKSICFILIIKKRINFYKIYFDEMTKINVNNFEIKSIIYY